MENTTSAISKHWAQLIWVAGLLFILGGIFSEFKVMHRDQLEMQANIEQLRIQVWQEIEQRVDDLEEWREYQKGLKDGAHGATTAAER